MTSRSQLAALLAIAGGLAAAGSMLLHWYTWDLAGMEDLAHRMLPSGAFTGMSKEQIDALLQTGLDSGQLPSHAFSGYRVFRPLSVGFHELWALLALLGGWRVYSGQGEIGSQGRAFTVSAVMLTVRPILAITRNPVGDIFESHGFANVHLVSPTYGVWVALLGALMVGVAAYLAFTAETWVAQHDQVELPDATPAGPFVPFGAAPAPAAYIPSAPTPAAAPLRATAAVPQPAARPVALFMSAEGPSMPSGPVPMPGAPEAPIGVMHSQPQMSAPHSPAAPLPPPPTDHSIYMTSHQGTSGEPDPATRPAGIPHASAAAYPAQPAEPEAYGIDGPIAPSPSVPPASPSYGSPAGAPSHPAGPYSPSVPAHIAAEPVAPAQPEPLPPYVAAASHHGQWPARGNTPEGAFLAMPVVHDDDGAYGAEGPSALDADARRAPRDDPYAPKRAAPAPHIAPAPAPSPVAPTAPPTQDAPSRQGSVAPPGMG